METLTIPELCDSLPSTATLREKLAEYFEETKDIIEKLTDDAAARPKANPQNSGDDSSTDEDEQLPSASFTPQQETIAKLRNLSDCIEESSFILAALADIKFNQCNQLECDMERRNGELLFLQQKITELKSSTLSTWSSTSPELLSLRRSHDSRLDYLCKVKRELTHEKLKNAQLQRKQAGYQADSAAINLSMSIECDRLREDLTNEKQKCDSRDKQIISLKRRLMEEKARNRAARLSTINKNSVKLLQKQLSALNVGGNKYKKAMRFKKIKVAQVKPFQRPRLSTAPSFSSSVSNNKNVFGRNRNQATSAQDIVKYLNDPSSHLVISRSFLNENSLPLMKQLPNELPVLTLDENF